MKTFSFIFARGGSKGIPNKNLQKIGGLNLVEHSLKISNSLDSIDHCFVSTDEPQIASFAKTYGAEVIIRPNYLATDSSPEWESWQHAIREAINRYGEFNSFLSLPPTSPLRELKDVKRCLLELDDKVDIVISITEANRNPWFNMVTVNKEGNLSLVNQNNSLAKDDGIINISRRQDAPLVYDMTTVAYVARPNYILKANNLWEGRVKGIKISKESSIDIDTPLDLSIARFLFQKNKISKK